MSAPELRSMLTRALLDAGPDGPTLCEGWRTRHLAAHLVLREHESWRMLGLFIPSRRPSIEALTLQMGDDAYDEYPELVDRFAAGPGRFSPWRAMDEPANVLEYAVHLEDVVRPAGLPPVEYSPELLDEIWRHFAGRARMMLHGTKARLALVADEQDGKYRVAVGANERDRPLVLVRGGVIELVLLAFGRPADVKTFGPHSAVTDLLGTRRAV